MGEDYVMSVTWREIVERLVHCSRPLQQTGWARLNKGLITGFSIVLQTPAS